MVADNFATRENQWITTLQKNGFRITQPRQAVLSILASTQHALDPIQIFDQARKAFANLSLVSVYRTLETLEDLGLVVRVHRADNCHAFVAGFQGHEHLLICDRCGIVQYFSGDDIHQLIQKVEVESKFTITEHWLQFFGTCSNCLPG